MTCVGDAVRLSRRDRAAMTLALCEVRGSSIGLSSAIEALRHTDGGAVPYLPPILVAAEAVMDDAIPWTTGTKTWRTVHYRNRDLVRARLALLLRAILRADAGDTGPKRAVCPACRAPSYVAGRRRVSDCSCKTLGWLITTAPYTPLWAIAPTRARWRRAAT
jgi:hypothetical protein